MTLNVNSCTLPHTRLTPLLEWTTKERGVVPFGQLSRIRFVCPAAAPSTHTEYMLDVISLPPPPLSPPSSVYPISTTTTTSLGESNSVFVLQRFRKNGDLALRAPFWSSPPPPPLNEVVYRLAGHVTADVQRIYANDHVLGEMGVERIGVTG